MMDKDTTEAARCSTGAPDSIECHSLPGTPCPDKIMPQMNAATWIETRFRKAVDVESDSESAYSHVKSSDVATAVQYFKEHIGATWGELISSKPSSIGGYASDVPWEQVRRFHKGIGGRPPTREYVTEKLGKAVIV